jgi:hypothetical protein
LRYVALTSPHQAYFSLDSGEQSYTLLCEGYCNFRNRHRLCRRYPLGTSLAGHNDYIPLHYPRYLSPFQTKAGSKAISTAAVPSTVFPQLRSKAGSTSNAFYEMYSCDVCNSRFSTKADSTRHKKSTGHCVCQHCRKAKASSQGLRAHNDAVHNHKCPHCSVAFAWRVLLTNHQKRQNHCYCGDCNRTFSTASGWKSHLQSSRHSTEFRCCDCDREFRSGASLDQHLRDKVHRLPATAGKRRPPCQKQKKAEVNGNGSTSPLQCTKCSREFKTADALQQHLASLKHCPLGKVPCIAGASCKATFPSPSALLHHLESGACSSGMNREKLNSLILKHDTERLITRQPADSGLLEDDTDSSGSWDLIRTPSSASLSSGDGCMTPASGGLSDWAVLLSRVPSHRCPLCPLGRRPFRDAKALQDHIKSAAHCEPFIYCPTTLAGSGNQKPGAIRVFTTVSGLAQHLESGACVGGKVTFRKVVKYLETRIQAFGLNFRLTT